MTSQSVANILGWMVAAAALAAAFVYGPLGQLGKPPKPAVEQAAPAPGHRGAAACGSPVEYPVEKRPVAGDNWGLTVDGLWTAKES